MNDIKGGPKNYAFQRQMYPKWAMCWHSFTMGLSVIKRIDTPCIIQYTMLYKTVWVSCMSSHKTESKPSDLLLCSTCSKPIENKWTFWKKIWNFWRTKNVDFGLQVTRDPTTIDLCYGYEIINNYRMCERLKIGLLGGHDQN